jgi:sacsin
VEYAKLKAACRDQLAPFDGLWGFNSDQASYNGTIFRFPLRKQGQASELLESERCPDVSMTIEIFRKLFEEARLSLLFLRNLTNINFSIKHSAGIEWRVRRGTWPPQGSFSDWAHILVEQRDSNGELVSMNQRWWRVIEDVQDSPAGLQHRHKRRMKNVECGMAALVPPTDKASRPTLPASESRFFNCLPLKFESTLPVHIHGTFLLSGDRQNISIEKTSQDAGSNWNSWLLREKLPIVYLQFLEDLGRKIGHDVYDYFPTASGRTEELSDLVRNSFWKQISSSKCRLFPVIDASHDFTITRQTNGRQNRTPPNLVTLKDAVFDLQKNEISRTLQPILCNCMEDLVRPSLKVRGHIDRTPEAKALTPAIVRGVLKSTAARKHVERAKQLQKDFLKVLLAFITPTTAAEAAELDGCHVLPLANGELGTLSLKSTDKSHAMFFSASASTQKLFPFASSLFTAGEAHEEFVTKILGFQEFNVKAFDKREISVVLKHKESWTPDATPKSWLVDFWEYVNSTSLVTGSWLGTPEVLDLNPLLQFSLLFLHDQGGNDKLISLHYLQNNPVVVQSDAKEDMRIFADFPGLRIVDSKTLPANIYHAERSLLNIDSMNRFLKSIKLLAARNAKTLSDFVKTNLKEENVKVGRL